MPHPPLPHSTHSSITSFLDFKYPEAQLQVTLVGDYLQVIRDNVQVKSYRDNVQVKVIRDYVQVKVKSYRDNVQVKVKSIWDYVQVQVKVIRDIVQVQVKSIRDTVQVQVKSIQDTVQVKSNQKIVQEQSLWNNPQVQKLCKIVQVQRCQKIIQDYIEIYLQDRKSYMYKFDAKKTKPFINSYTRISLRILKSYYQQVSSYGIMPLNTNLTIKYIYLKIHRNVLLKHDYDIFCKLLKEHIFQNKQKLVYTNYLSILLSYLICLSLYFDWDICKDIKSNFIYKLYSNQYLAYYGGAKPKWQKTILDKQGKSSFSHCQLSPFLINKLNVPNDFDLNQIKYTSSDHVKRDFIVQV